MKAATILMAALLCACSTSARGWARIDGESVVGFDGRYFYAEGTGKFHGFVDLKTGERLIPPADYDGEYRIGWDLKTRAGIDPDIAQAFVFPAGIPAPTP